MHLGVPRRDRETQWYGPRSVSGMERNRKYFTSKRKLKEELAVSHAERTKPRLPSRKYGNPSSFENIHSKIQR